MLALDLFCGEGGVCLGLQAAGFTVVGVDSNDKCGKVYPGIFVHGDALNPPFNLSDFDFVWASPPCPAFSAITPLSRKSKVLNLIPQTRSLLALHAITCIENVPPAPIRPDLVLTGPTVGLRSVERRRHFELSFQASQPVIRSVTREEFISGKAITVSTGETVSRRKMRETHGTPRPGRREMLEAMGIQHEMSFEGVANAIPPIMAEYIGREALAFLRGERYTNKRLPL